MAQNTDTPPETLEAATEENALPTHSLSLVGTFDKADGTTALIRMATGEIRMVGIGDKIGTSTVMGVEMGVLHLARGGDIRKLTMPEEGRSAALSGDVRPMSRPVSPRG